MKNVYSEEKEYHLQITETDVGEYVILTGDPGRCEGIAGLLEDAEKKAANREFITYTGKLCGEKVSVVSTGIGGPSAAIALEELAHCGARIFIRIGTSGGMQAEVLGGDLVIASGAVRMEGTSREYAPIEYPAVADFRVVAALARAAAQMGRRYHVGVVQCKDSFYGQHDPDSMPAADELKRKWKAWIRCGVLASEMESAALFTVGAVRRLQMGTVLLVIGNQTRREMGLEDVQCHDTSRAAEIAIEAIKLLINEEKDQGGNVL